MKNNFGKDCIHFTATYEDERRRREEGESEFKEEEPVLVYCNNKDNAEDCEGNCRPELCPLGFTKELFDYRFVKLADPLPGTVFSKYKESIRKALFRSRGQCPCVSDPSLQSDDTICPCKVYRETLECKCNLYVRLM